LQPKDLNGNGGKGTTDSELDLKIVGYFFFTLGYKIVTKVDGIIGGGAVSI